MNDESLYAKRRDAGELAFFTVMGMSEMWAEFSKWKRCDVLILGLPKSGKSSLVNLITERSVAKINDGERAHFSHYDTYIGCKHVALINACSDMKQWYKYFRENRTESYNLVLYVMRMGRVAGNVEVVHFIRAAFGHIPILLIITHCEDHDINTWNRGNFRDIKRSLNIGEMECVTTVEDVGDAYRQNINQKRAFSRFVLHERLAKSYSTSYRLNDIFIFDNTNVRLRHESGLYLGTRVQITGKYAELKKEGCVITIMTDDAFPLCRSHEVIWIKIRIGEKGRLLYLNKLGLVKLKVFGSKEILSRRSFNWRYEKLNFPGDEFNSSNWFLKIGDVIRLRNWNSQILVGCETNGAVACVNRGKGDKWTLEIA